ncbi:hypothetical protein LOCC1_G005986 [Lachnellula occidentalis]|uniref:Rhodopsin domain-containing protein n=1 Tax=Lachnellula occidentalis TaxID=215460 RepID=A0A8H8RL57_9HELO|nr:hypothetical protein LOCC1_G005986 [Lachnellula occidentalis]
MYKPQGRGPELIGVTGFLMALSSVTTLLRCYSRAVLVKSFGADDCFAIAGCYHGTGQHSDLIPPAELPVGLKWWWCCELVYVLSNMFLKLSIGIMLLRLTIVKTHRFIIYAVLAVLELYGVAYLLLFILQCRPSNYFWTRYTGGKGKVNGASTATIIRIPYVQDLSNQADFLWATTDVAIWSGAETGIGIAASAIATLRPFFRTFFNRSRLLGGSSGQTPGNGISGAQNKGYTNRSQHLISGDAIRLRDDVGKEGCATTVTADGGHGDMEGGIRKEFEVKVSRGSSGSTNKNGLRFGGEDSESELV